jgi:hypothetical protein
MPSTVTDFQIFISDQDDQGIAALEAVHANTGVF